MKKGHLLVLPCIALIVLGVYYMWVLAPIQFSEYLAQADSLTKQGYFHTMNHPYRVYYPYIFMVAMGIIGVLAGLEIAHSKSESGEA